MQNPTKQPDTLDKSKPFTRRKLLLNAAASTAVYNLCKTNTLAEPTDKSSRQKTKSAYTATDIANVFEKIAPFSTGVPNDELGFIYGNHKSKVNGIACVWQVDASSITAAAEQGLNMIICHERLWLPPQKSPWYQPPSPENIKPNQIRKKLLDQHKMVVYRSHSNWDALPKDGQPDQAVKALGIDNLTVVSAHKFFKVHRLPEQMTVAELKDCARKGLGFNGCRIFGDPNKQIRQFAFLIGGFGVNQRHMPQVAMETGAEVIIIGEMSEFIVIAALEMGLPVIETLHSVSEIPGVRRQAEILAENFPALNVKYIPSGALAFNFQAAARFEV
ncbi:MAG: Nif3-like dinuclear metal center hexameric protein [Planctomycetota bacterium]|jgi:putative NIF3 family GTP cyclohydrolase 1 type 2